MENKTSEWVRPGDDAKRSMEQASRKCAECHREITIGEDAIALERIVMGPRGPVPIDDMKFFHISRCLADYVCSTEGGLVPSRIP